MLKRLSRIVFLCITFVLFPFLAKAIILSPPIIDLQVPAGATREVTLTVINDSSAEVKFHLYTTDVTKDRKGKLDFPSAGTYKYSCAKNIKLETEYITIPPEAIKEIKVKISIPSNTSGGRYAAIMCETIPEERLPGQLTITPRWRMGSIVKLTIPGKTRKQAEISNISYQPPTSKEGETFICTIKNPGNIHLADGNGNLNIMGEQKRIVERMSLKIDKTVLPESDYDLIVSPRRPLRPGTYTALASIRFQEITAVSKEIKFKIEGKDSKGVTSATSPSLLLEITPSEIKAEIPAGGYRSFPLQLENKEMTLLKITTRVSDISYDEEGKIRYLEAGKTPYSLNNILKINPEEIIIEPNRKKSINLICKVDKEKTGGLYGNLILMINSVDTEYMLAEKRNVKMEVLISKTIKEAGKLGEIEIIPGKEKIDLGIKFLNEGNVVLKPKGEAKILYKNLEDVGNVLFEEFPVMPGEIVSMTGSYQNPKKPLLPGKYNVSIKITYGEKNSLFTQKEFIIK